MRKPITIAFVMCLALVTCFYSQRRIDAIRAADDELDMLFLPNEKLLNHFTGGLSSVVADILWLKTIQYTVSEFHNPERKFTWLDHMCTTVTRLDPYYVDAYAYGGMLLAAIGGDENAMKLLRKGAINNPESEEIPFEMAKIWILNRYEEPYAEEMAVKYLRMVAERSEEHADFYFNWIRGIQVRSAPGESARALWEDILRTAEDEIIIELAKSNLLQLTLEANVKMLREVAEKYRGQEGTAPESLEDLVRAGMLPSLPSDPGHGRYFVDADGIVQNSLLLNRRAVQLRTFLNNEMERYKEAKGRYPYTLHEWSAWTGADIPQHPRAGQTWEYNSNNGTVN